MIDHPEYRCERCGHGMIAFREGRTQGTRCEQCGWSLVTTYTPPIQLDQNVYQVRVKYGNPLDIAQVKAIASLTKGNFLQARASLKRDLPLVFSGNAQEVEKVRNLLRTAGIIVEIQPEFPW